MGRTFARPRTAVADWMVRGLRRSPAISDAIPTMGALTELNISSNELGRFWNGKKWISDMTGVKALAAALPECK